ncbi:MAG: transcription antitermination factor NusB [Candidatus Nanopelagicales bacterium]|jgi:N utilization substance protein B
MKARTKARKRALDILFEADLKGISVEQVWSEADQTDEFVKFLVTGVASKQAEIDQMISTASSSWSIERMPAVDRNLLRLAIFELKNSTETPKAVVISEAIELANTLSTDDSANFINGILANI